jgi:hypothetical protein
VTRKYFLFSFLAGAFVVLNPLSSSARSRTVPASSIADQEYVSALGGANNFLHAWQSQDHETSLLMLTETAKHDLSEDRLQDFFSPGSSTQRSYEISRGKKLSAGRFEFPVALFELDPARKWTHPRFSQIVMLKTGKDEWSVDKLP